MLKSLRFTNFKSWAEVEMDCAPITGVFGTNSSGKSSLLQFLLLLKQTKDATDRAVSLELNGDLVQLGTIRDAIHKHDEKRSIEVGICFQLPKKLTLNDANQDPTPFLASDTQLALSASVDIHEDVPVSTRLAYTLGDMQFELALRDAQRRSFTLSGKSLGEHDNWFAPVRTPGRPETLPGPTKLYGFPDQVRTDYQNTSFLADLEVAYERALDGIHYLGPHRELPQRDYLWAGPRPTDVGQRGEKVMDAILAATAAREERNLGPKMRRRPFQHVIAHWLRKLNLAHGFEITEIVEGSNRYQAKVTTRKGGTEVLLTDVGFSTSQVLPIITLLQYVPEGSTVILERPEIHLHPLAQAGLADVIIQAATHRKVQVILESHSEHLLLRLQRRVAEQAISYADVRLYSCDAPADASRLTQLELDHYGSIRNWPDKFMGDSFTETVAAENARLKRMQAGESSQEANLQRVGEASAQSSMRTTLRKPAAEIGIGGPPTGAEEAR